MKDDDDFDYYHYHAGEAVKGSLVVGGIMLAVALFYGKVWPWLVSLF